MTMLPKQVAHSVVALLLLSCLPVVFGSEATPSHRLEAIASELGFLCTDELLYNRIRAYGIPKPQADKYKRLIKLVISHDASVPELTKMLKNENPKVRTLAIVALFARDDPGVLHHIASMVDDSSLTFPRPAPHATWYPEVESKLPPMEEQTVGEIAEKAVRFYIERAGYYYGVKGCKPLGGFNEYWRIRKDREYCASWFSVRLARASRGISPVKDVQEVRELIGKLPEEDQVWTLLWLYGETGSEKLVTEGELVQGCKKLGPERLLLMLQRKIPSQDPDLQPRDNNNWPYKRMTLFVLRHARELLRSEDSEKLLACERWERDYQKHRITDPTITPWWAVAAAYLRTEDAGKILLRAYRRFQGEFDSEERSEIMIALWQLKGESQARFITDWFYNEKPERGAFPNCRSHFVKAMSQADKPSSKRIIARIIRDSRFDTIDWQSLETLVRLVNGWLDTPIVSEEELDEARHPLGQGHFHWEQVGAARDHPKETKELRRTLGQWRKQLLESVPRWSGER